MLGILDPPPSHPTVCLSVMNTKGWRGGRGEVHICASSFWTLRNAYLSIFIHTYPYLAVPMGVTLSSYALLFYLFRTPLPPSLDITQWLPLPPPSLLVFLFFVGRIPDCRGCVGELDHTYAKSMVRILPFFVHLWRKRFEMVNKFVLATWKTLTNFYDYSESRIVISVPAFLFSLINFFLCTCDSE